MTKSRESAEKVEAAIASLPPEPQIHDVVDSCQRFGLNLYFILNVARLGHLLSENEQYLLKN
jgi:hypothetical protein